MREGVLHYARIGVPQGVVDDLLIGRVATHNGEVLLMDPPLHKLPLHGRIHSFGQREEQHPARLAVEPMHGPHALPQLVAQPLHGKLAGVAGHRRAVDEQAVGFVDSYQVRGLVEDGERVHTVVAKYTTFPQMLLVFISSVAPVPFLPAADWDVSTVQAGCGDRRGCVRGRPSQCDCGYENVAPFL